MKLFTRATLLATAFFCAVGAVAEPKSAGLDLSAYHGQVVYLDFWASWCGPCRQSFPWMEEVQHRFGKDGLKVVAVDVDASPADGQKFLSEFPHSFTVIADPAGKIAEKYPIKGMPTGVLIDRSGNVVLVHEGFRPKDRDALEAQIRSLLSTT